MITLVSRHGHCDTCGRCAQDDGAPGSRIRQTAVRHIRQAGWTTDSARVGCPAHPVTR